MFSDSEDWLILSIITTIAAVSCGFLWLFWNSFSRKSQVERVENNEQETTLSPTSNEIQNIKLDDVSQMNLSSQDSIREKQQSSHLEIAREKEKQRKKEELQKIDDEMKRLKLGEYRLGKGYQLGTNESLTKEEFVSKQQLLIDQFSIQKEKEEEIEEESRKEKQEILRMQSLQEEEQTKRQLLEARNKQQATMDSKLASYLEQKEVREKENLIKRLKELEKMKIEKKEQKEEFEVPLSDIEIDRIIREQQELEYKKSLEEDEEKEILKMIQEQSKLEEQERIKNLNESRKNRAKQIPEEIVVNQDIVSIGIKFPSGKRASRRFSLNQCLKEVVEFAEEYLVDEEFIEQYSLFTNFPRKELSKIDSSTLLKDIFGNTKSEMLFIEK